MSATAVRDGDDYVLNGRRVFVGNSHVGELHFDNCRVPAPNRLGEEGDGLSVAYSSSALHGRPSHPWPGCPLGRPRFRRWRGDDRRQDCGAQELRAYAGFGRRRRGMLPPR